MGKTWADTVSHIQSQISWAERNGFANMAEALKEALSYAENMVEMGE